MAAVYPEHKYRGHATLTFSQFATACGLVGSIRELLDGVSADNPYTRAGTAWEPYIRALFFKHDPRFEQRVLPAVPASLSADCVAGVPGLFVGTTDNISEHAVIDFKLLCTAPLPSDQLPVRYLPQLECCMRSWPGLDTAYLVFYRPVQVPTEAEGLALQQRLARGELPHFAGDTLQVWRYERNDMFWYSFVVPRLKRYVMHYRLKRAQDPKYAPTCKRASEYYDPEYLGRAKATALALQHLPVVYSHCEMTRVMFPPPVKTPLFYTPRIVDSEEAERAEIEPATPSFVLGCERLERRLQLVLEERLDQARRSTSPPRACTATCAEASLP